MGSKQKRKLARMQREVAYAKRGASVFRDMYTKSLDANGMLKEQIRRMASNPGLCQYPIITSYDSFLRALRQLPPTGRESRRPMSDLVIPYRDTPALHASNMDLDTMFVHDAGLKTIRLTTQSVVIPSLGKRYERTFGWALPAGLIIVDMEPRSETY